MADRLFRLCLVTDRRQTAGRALLDVIALAVQSGVDAVQLREKDLAARALLDLAVQLRDLCRRSGAVLLINDRIDVALAAGAGGVHLPADSFSPRDARGVLGPDPLIGVSTHSVSDARAAAATGADYVIFGPVYPTPSKQAYGPPLGLGALAEVVESVPIPVLAIGGITPERVSAVRARGAHGVAVISAILSAGDPRAASRSLRDGLDAIR